MICRGGLCGTACGVPEEDPWWGSEELHLGLGSRQEEEGMGKVRGDAKRTEWEVLAELGDPVRRALGYRSV